MRGRDPSAGTSETTSSPDLPARRIEPLRIAPRPAVRDWADRHGFSPELVARWVEFLPEPQRLLDALLHPVPRFVRLNTLRGDADAVLAALRAREFELVELAAPDPRLRVLRIEKEPYSISATPEYLSGALYLQDLASLTAAAALAPEPGDRILDMAAAPGGKTTALAEMVGDDASILAVEPMPRRAAALAANLRRLRVSGAGVVVDGAEAIEGEAVFDRILLDAPCTGEGVLPRDSNRRRGVLEEHAQLAGLQRRLLGHAIRLLKPGGTLVYSTCTFSPEECEEVVIEAMRLGLEPEPLPFDSLHDAALAPALERAGDRRYGDAVRHARRIYPHRHRTLGFFLARLRKPEGWDAERLAAQGAHVPTAPEPGRVVRVGTGAVNEWDGDVVALDAVVESAKGSRPTQRGNRARSGRSGSSRSRKQAQRPPRQRVPTDEELHVETVGVGDARGRGGSEGGDEADTGADGRALDGDHPIQHHGKPAHGSDPAPGFAADIRDLYEPERADVDALLALYGDDLVDKLLEQHPGHVLKVLGRPDLAPQRRVVLVDQDRVRDLARHRPATLGIPIATLARQGAKLTLEGGALIAPLASRRKAGLREKGEQLFLYGRDILGKSLAWVDAGTAKGDVVLVLDAKDRRYLGLGALVLERRTLEQPRNADEVFLRHLQDLGEYLRAEQDVPQ